MEAVNENFSQVSSEDILKDSLEILDTVRNMTQDMPPEVRGITTPMIMVIMVIVLVLALSMPFIRLCLRHYQSYDTIDNGGERGSGSP